jgi:hypothetical protein
MPAISGRRLYSCRKLQAEEGACREASIGAGATSAGSRVLRPANGGAAEIGKMGIAIMR